MRRGAWTSLLLGLACGPEPGADVDRGPIEATVGFAERVSWPGVDRAAGRVIPFVRGFAHGGPSGYWFLSFGSRNTVDAFFSCRQGDPDCPLDPNRRLNWEAIVGRPIFSHIPGDPEFSPFWQVWKVTVPPGYVADSVKTIESLHRLDAAGVVTVEPLIIDFGKFFGEPTGPSEVVLHCALVLSGTDLENNGGPMPDGSANMLRLERRRGWHKGYSVEFMDFTPSDGVFPQAADSDSRPRMRFANLYIIWRWCQKDPKPRICGLPGYAYADRRPVSERGLGQDITGEGDSSDTNNVLGATPCGLRRPTERPYSPLWAPQQSFVQDPYDLALIDTYADRNRSDVASADALFDATALGILDMPKAMREDETGNPVPGNEGQIFFNCPAPVPEGFVPYPCEANR